MTRRLQYSSRPSRENCGHWVRWVLLPPSLATVSLIAPSLVALKRWGPLTCAASGQQASAPPNLLRDFIDHVCEEMGLLRFTHDLV